MHEDIPILNFLVPKEFTHDNGKLTGVVFEKVKAEYDAKGRRNLVPTGEPDQHFACDDVLVAVGQENAFPWIERDIGIEFDKWDMPKVDRQDHAVDATRRCSSAATPRSARRTSSGRWRTATTPRSRSTSSARGEDVNDRPPPMVDIVSQKMGIHEWSYDNDIALDKRYQVPLRDKVVALHDIKAEVELGFDVELALQGGAALPELRRADRVRRDSCASSATPASTSARWTASPSPQNGEEADLRTRLKAPAQEPDAGPLRRRRPQDRPRHGEGRGRLPALRAVRRALPDRRLGHAEISHRHDSRG